MNRILSALTLTSVLLATAAADFLADPTAVSADNDAAAGVANNRPARLDNRATWLEVVAAALVTG